jgi:hypothetical protein
VYYQDAQDLEDLGWDRVVAGIWETIFVGYRSMAGIRTIARHWSDLLQVGAGCSPELADELVRDEVFVRADRDLFAVKDPVRLLAAMAAILTDFGADLAESAAVPPADRAALVAGHQAVVKLLADEFGSPDDDA